MYMLIVGDYACQRQLLSLQVMTYVDRLENLDVAILDQVLERFAQKHWVPCTVQSGSDSICI